MKNFTKTELQEMLLDSIEVYKKLQYSNSHEYSIEPNAITKMFTNADAKRMDEIIKKLELDK